MGDDDGGTSSCPSSLGDGERREGTLGPQGRGSTAPRRITPPRDGRVRLTPMLTLSARAVALRIPHQTTESPRVIRGAAVHARLQAADSPSGGTP